MEEPADLVWNSVIEGTPGKFKIELEKSVLREKDSHPYSLKNMEKT